MKKGLKNDPRGRHKKPSQKRPKRMTFKVFNGNCLDLLKTIDTGSIDCVITDPIYPEIKRDYGFISEVDWLNLMDEIIPDIRRILSPKGSAIFVLQNNSSRAGSIRPWLYKFLAKWVERWNIVQDLYWWNYVSLPGGGATKSGLCRQTVKHLVWLGDHDCYRNQDAILWGEAEEGALKRASSRCQRGDVHQSPSGYVRDRMKVHEAAARRGGVTPFNIWPLEETPNVFPICNNQNPTGHSASTPIKLCRNLVKYLCPPGGVVLDPFCGHGSVGLAAIEEGRRFLGIEIHEEIYKEAERLLNATIRVDPPPAPVLHPAPTV